MFASIRDGHITALLLSLALSLTATACLPTYDPDEVTLKGGGAAGNNGATDCEPTGIEVCDGVDNDCNGRIDEDFPRRGIPCGSNIGVCAAVVICEAGAELCYEITSPSDEICDGLDNDCNGQTDEITDTDPLNCGECGEVCEFANGQPGCNNGQCLLVGCNPGFEDCDQDPNTGCETDTTSDPVNCGGCGNICGDDSAETVCRSGQCEIETCVDDRQDCNGFALDGCEADPAVDIFNCGACNRRCDFDNAIAQCAEMACTFSSCLDGFVNLDVDDSNGCEVGLRVVGSPPDANLGNLTVAGGLLYGSAGNQLFGYQVTADGTIGSLLFNWTASSNIAQLDATGNTLFMSLEAGDVQILDTTNVEALNTLGLAVTSGPAPGFYRDAQMLYIADGRDGLRVVDVTDPSRPRLTGRAASQDFVSQVYANATRVILNSPDRPDMELYDISDPTFPKNLGTYELVQPFDIAVLRSDLFVTALRGQRRINIYRISDDNQLTFLGNADLPGRVAALEQRYPFLVAVVGEPGNPLSILTIDIRRPQRPSITNIFNTQVPNNPSSAAFTATQIYVAGDGGLQRFDISDLRRPAGAQDLVRPRFLKDLAINNNKLFVAADGAVEVLDITSPQSPSRIARFGTTIESIAVSDVALYVTSPEQAVASYLLSNLGQTGDTAPIPFAVYSGELPLAIAPSADNTFVYALYTSRLDVIELRTDQSVLRSSTPMNTDCRRMIRHEQYLYAACTAGIGVVNVSSPDAPTVSLVGGGDNLFDVQLFGQTLYGLADNGIAVYTVNAPGAINFRNTSVFENLTGLRRMTGLQLWMVLSSGSNAVLVDRSNLTNPRSVVSRNLGSGLIDLVSSTDSVYAGTNGGVFRLAVDSPQ